MSFSRDSAMNWGWFGILAAGRDRNGAHASRHRPTELEAPSTVDVRMASGSVVRVSFDPTTKRMCFGRVH